MDESKSNMQSKMITHKQDGIRQQNVDKKIIGKQSIERTFSGTILVRDSQIRCPQKSARYHRYLPNTLGDPGQVKVTKDNMLNIILPLRKTYGFS
jgi:hypothetical protein